MTIITAEIVLKNKNNNELAYSSFLQIRKIFLNARFIFFILLSWWFFLRGCRGRDRMVVAFTTTYAISAYHQ